MSLPCRFLYEKFGTNEFTSAQAELSYEIGHYKRLLYVIRVRREHYNESNGSHIRTVWKLTERGIRKAKKEIENDE